MSTSPVIRHARRARAFNLAAVSFSAASALLQVLAFHQVTFWVPVLLVFAAVNVFCAAAGTRNLRRLQARARRPDYAVIARLERGIWGQAFEHAGVPSLPTRPGPPGLPPATVAQRGGYGAAGYLDDLCLYVSRLANSPDPAVRKCARAWLIREADDETRRLTAQYPQTLTGRDRQVSPRAMTRIGPAGPVHACCGTTPGTGHLRACPAATVAMITPGTVGLWEIFVPPPAR